MHPFAPTHVSHKTVEAYPLDHLEKREDGRVIAFVQNNGVLRDIEVPANITARGEPQPGSMLVRYAPNENEPDGYLAFSPREPFEAGYAAIQLKGLDIGQAKRALAAGYRVARAGWNGKGMYLELQVPDAHSKMSLPYVFMFTACKNRVPWLCSQTDFMASDWEVVS